MGLNINWDDEKVAAAVEALGGVLLPTMPEGWVLERVGRCHGVGATGYKAVIRQEPPTPGSQWRVEAEGFGEQPGNAVRNAVAAAIIEHGATDPAGQ